MIYVRYSKGLVQNFKEMVFMNSNTGNYSQVLFSLFLSA